MTRASDRYRHEGTGAGRHAARGAARYADAELAPLRQDAPPSRQFERQRGHVSRQVADFRRRAAPDVLRRLRDVQGRVARRHDDVRVGPARPVRRELLLDRARFHEFGGGLSLDAVPGAQAPRHTGGAGDEDRGRDADLQREPGTGLRRRRRDARGRTGDEPGRGVRLVLSLRHDQSRRVHRRGARVPANARTPRPRRARLLPSPARQLRAQGRQYRRLRHALGRPLRADGRARRR